MVTVAISWTVTVPQLTPSLNRYLRMPWPEKRRLKLEWLQLLKVCELDQKARIPDAHGRRRVTIVRRGRQVMDQDNFIGGCKELIVDNLRAPLAQKLKTGRWRSRVGLGWIVDDSERWLVAHYRQQVIARGERPETVLIVQEAGA